MLKWVVARSLRYCGVVSVLACLVAAYGVYIAGRVKLDVFPEFAPPRIVIQTEAPGLSAEEVEALVTRPVEYGLNGTPELEVIYSESIQGLSVVTTVFREDADIYRVRQLTGERLAEITGQLPEGVKAPRMGQLTSATSLTLALGMIQSLSPEALGEVVLAYHDGFSVRLKDVAGVTEGPEPKLRNSQVAGRPGVVMLVAR